MNPDEKIRKRSARHSSAEFSPALSMLLSAEQVGSALIAHARDFIQCGAAHLFAAQLAVILDGERAELTRARVRWRSSLTMPKHGTEPERVEHLAHVNDQTAVDHERAGQRRKLLVAVHIRCRSSSCPLAEAVTALSAGPTNTIRADRILSSRCNLKLALFSADLDKHDHRADRSRRS